MQCSWCWYYRGGIIMNNRNRTYEECLICDNNWYTYTQMAGMYPTDQVYCIARKDNEATLYQPKVVTTSNLDAYLLAMDDYSCTNIGGSTKYFPVLFTGPRLSATNNIPQLREVIITKRDNYYWKCCWSGVFLFD